MQPDAWVLGSTFSGIGGMALAAQWVGWRTAFVADPEPYAAGILARHFPDAPNLGDVREIDGTRLGGLDVLTAGFPCQDISPAGRGAGITGDRSGLWREVARLVGESRPRYLLAENSSALRTRGLDVVLGDLSALGYDAEWHCIPASSVGAPHQRDRIWILAYPEGTHARPVLDSLPHADGERVSDEGPGEAARAPGTVQGADEEWQRLWPDAGECPDPRRGDWWGREPAVGRVAYGVPHRLDRSRCLGNSIVPRIPYLIFRAIRAVDQRPSVTSQWSATVDPGARPLRATA